VIGKTRNPDDQTDLIIDDLLGELTDEESRTLASEMVINPKLAGDYQEYKKLISNIQSLKSVPEHTPELSSKILAELEKEKVRRWWRPASFSALTTIGSLAASIMILLLVKRPSLNLNQKATDIPVSQYPSASTTSSYNAVSFANYNDWRIAKSEDVFLTYLNGALGALIMVGCAIIGIIFLAVATKSRSRRKNIAIALFFFAVAIACFMLRSAISYFYNSALLAQ
jgi:ABC-type sugar transport system permease subunit